MYKRVDITCKIVSKQIKQRKSMFILTNQRKAAGEGLSLIGLIGEERGVRMVGVERVTHGDSIPKRQWKVAGCWGVGIS
jgi:hypothetical protein